MQSLKQYLNHDLEIKSLLSFTEIERYLVSLITGLQYHNEIMDLKVKHPDVPSHGKLKKKCSSGIFIFVLSLPFCALQRFQR